MQHTVTIVDMHHNMADMLPSLSGDAIISRGDASPGTVRHHYVVTPSSAVVTRHYSLTATPRGDATSL
jgi:hypothetical protein